MKRTLFLLGCFVVAMASCGSPEQKATSNSTDTTPSTSTAPATASVDTTPVTPPPAPAAPEKFVGEDLIAKSDCLGCHNKTKKIVGPAYVNIAAKYPNTEENITSLADKIIAGGSGVWGAVPMTPHPAITKDDAKEMVKYILSLKK